MPDIKYLMAVLKVLCNMGVKQEVRCLGWGTKLEQWRSSCKNGYLWLFVRESLAGHLRWMAFRKRMHLYDAKKWMIQQPALGNYLRNPTGSPCLNMGRKTLATPWTNLYCFFPMAFKLMRSNSAFNLFLEQINVSRLKSRAHNKKTDLSGSEL